VPDPRFLSMLAVVLASLPVACRDRRTTGADAAPAAAPSSSIASRLDDASVRDAAAAPRAAPSPDALATYSRAIGAGRAASKNGDTAAAIQSFTSALAALPDDPQATGERGFAEMQAGDNDGARADFDREITVGGSPTLRAQLHFNVGLLEEKAGHMEAARAAYARSQRLHPTAAAAAKLEGHLEACPLALVELSPVTAYGSWPAAVHALLPDVTAATAQAARDALCAAESAECRKLDDDHVLLVVDADGRTVHALIEDGPSVYVVRRVSERIAGAGFKCPDGLPTMRAHVDRGTVRFDSIETLCNTVCTSRSWVDCSGNQLGTRQSVSLWDLQARQPILGVTWDDPTSHEDALEQLTVDADGMLRFQGCNLRRRVPLHEVPAQDGGGKHP
jgi:tetratricopeptide (TPR) repeat protein